MLKKILKIAAWLFGIFLGLLLVIALLIQVPAVQNKIVQQVASTLSETLNTKVELRRVVLKPFKTLALKGVYLESQQQDTLVYAEEVGVNLSVLRLLKQRIHVREIYLEGAKIQLHRAQADSLFNYQFLIDAFASDQPKDTTASPSTWTFGLDEVSIQDSYFRMLDEYGYTDTEFTIQDFEVQMGDLDLEKQLVDINLIRLKNSSFRYAFLENEVEVPLVDSLVANTADASLAFPDLGWDVYLNRMSLVDNQVIFEDQNSQRIKNALDFEHLNLQDLNIEVRDVQWVEDLMKGKIKEIHFRDHSGFELEHFASNLKLDPRSGSIEKFELRTPNSVFKASATASFSQFSDLVNQLEEKVQFDLEIANARLTFKDLNYFAPSFTEIKQLNTKLERAMRLDGKVAGTLNDLQTIRVNFAVADDIVLKAKGKAQKVTDPDALTYDIQLQELATFYDKIKNLTRNVEIPSGLDSLGRIQLSGNFKGGMNKVRGKNIQFRTDAYTGFRGDLVARHLTDGQPIAFDLDIIEMRTQASDLNGFVEGGLPPEVARMGKMQYSGKIVGDVYNIDSKGQLNTEVGQLDTDARISFSQDYADASYRGQLALQQFDLGQVLQDTSIGKVSLEVEGAGSGLAVDSLQAEFNGRIVAFDYLDYEYHDLTIDGLVNRKQFQGKANFQDPNLTFNFEGNVNLNDSIPDLAFTALIDTINLPNLHFDSIPYAFSGDIYSNFRGNNLDNIAGKARIENSYLSNDTLSVALDSIRLLADETKAGKRIQLRSKFFNFLLEGDYNIAELPQLMTNFVNDYFPVDQFISPEDEPADLAIEPNTPPSELPDQSLRAQFELDHPIPLFNLFVSGFEVFDTASAIFQLDTKAKDLQLDAKIPQLSFQGNALSSVALQLQGTPALLEGILQAKAIDYGMEKPLSLVQMDIGLENNEMEVRLRAEEAAGDSTYTKLALGGKASNQNGFYRFVFNPEFWLNNTIWQVDPANEIRYKENLLDVNDFSISEGIQRLAFRTDDESQDQDIAPLQLQLNNFKIEEILRLINMEEAAYGGEISGALTVRSYTTNLNYLADINIQNITLEEQKVGNLNIKATQNTASPIINIDAALKGQKGNFSAKGTYGIEAGDLDLKADVSRLKLALLDPFMFGLIEESRGELTGDFRIKGTADAPLVDGALVLDSISTVLGISGVRYGVLKEKIEFKNGKMDFGRMQMKDKNGYPATLSGQMDISDLEDITMNLNFKTDRFQVLNTTSQDEELYYGKLLLSANVDIRGTANEPVITMKAKTLDKTQLFVQPLTVEEAVASQEDYIIFANPNEYLAEDSTRSLQQAYQSEAAGIDLTLNLEVTPDAELQIVIDPATGDKLVCRGTAQMTVDMTPAGDLDILGNYRITNGSYALNYQGLLKKNFTLRAGSRLDFVGDPLATRFDVGAIYTTSTPTFELIRNRVTDENGPEALAAKKRTDVNVVMNMQGDLDEPIISFDIQIPESGGVTSTTRQELARLRDNPNELNKQVFSLLLLNAFISQQSGGGSIADAGTSVYLSSVSSLLSNQLNRLADNYIKGVDVNIGIDAYQAEYSENTITELNLGVSKQLFNDRVSVQVGGNVNVNSENALLVEGANFSSIAGDFVLECKLTEAGNYRLRVFRRENFDVLNQDNAPQTGVGLTFRKSFGEVGKEKKSEDRKAGRKQGVGLKEE